MDNVPEAERQAVKSRIREAFKLDGTGDPYKSGVPSAVLHAFAEYYKDLPQYLDARAGFFKCKSENGWPQDCIEASLNMFQTVNDACKVPFRVCPEPSYDYVKCLEDKDTNFRLCRREQDAWRDCMVSQVGGCSFAPYPVNPMDSYKAFTFQSA